MNQAVPTAAIGEQNRAKRRVNVGLGGQKHDYLKPLMLLHAGCVNRKLFDDEASVVLTACSTAPMWTKHLTLLKNHSIHKHVPNKQPVCLPLYQKFFVFYLRKDLADQNKLLMGNCLF